MVAVNIRRAQWAAVEFQPDLKHPADPVRLGLVLYEPAKTGGRVVIIGRLPKPDSRPAAFKDTSSTTMQIAANWVTIMAKDAVDGAKEDLFTRLTENWHWNLYVSEPTEITLTASADLTQRAKALFKRFVGETFTETLNPRKKVAAKLRRRTPAPAIARSSDVPHYTPQSWLIAQIAPQLAAHQN